MAKKKGFKASGLDALTGGSFAPSKLGRPKTNLREITKTSQIGTKAGETRATFIMNEEQLENIKAIAYWDRVSIKDVLCHAIDDYLSKKKSDLSKARNAFKSKGKG